MIRFLTILKKNGTLSHNIKSRRIGIVRENFPWIYLFASDFGSLLAQHRPTAHHLQALCYHHFSMALCHLMEVGHKRQHDDWEDLNLSGLDTKPHRYIHDSGSSSWFGYLFYHRYPVIPGKIFQYVQSLLDSHKCTLPSLFAPKQFFGSNHRLMWF